MVALEEVRSAVLSGAPLLKNGPAQGIPLFRARLNTPVEAAVNACRDRARARRVTIYYGCDREITAEINPALIEQAVFHLLDNAIRFSAPNSPVLIETLRVGDQVRVRVRDWGCGIETSLQQRIFDPFYVGHAVDSSKPQNGLGLAIARFVAELHGGRISLTSRRGEGSVFSLRLSCAEA